MNEPTKCALDRLSPSELAEATMLANWILARHGPQAMLRILNYRKISNASKYLNGSVPWRRVHLQAFRLFLPSHEIETALRLQT